MELLRIEDKISKLAEALEDVIPEKFGYEQDTDGYFEDMYGSDDIYYITTKLLGDSYDISSGASKAVIVPEHFNYVLKMPINGEWEIEYYYDEETDDYDYDCIEDEYFNLWSGAPGDDETDYCNGELTIYKEACKENLGHLFAKIERISSRVYKQEKVKYEEGCSNHSSSDSYKKVSEIQKSYKPAYRVPTNWLATVMDYYGELTVYALTDFIERHEINDLHSGNVGFRSNGEPVLVDYSGWGG